MLKLCILGNSHIASLKLGWEEIKLGQPEIQADFFAQAGNDGLATVVVKGGKLTSENKDVRKAFVRTYGKEYLRIANYDSFLIYGARSRTYWPSGGFFSSACLDAAISDLTRETPAQLVLNALRQETDAPIYVGHTPLLAARTVRDRTASDSYQEGIDILNHRHYINFGAEFVGQPTETMVNGRATAPEYSWGVKKLSAAVGIDDAVSDLNDNTHMNATFGALWLQKFFTTTLHL